MTQNQFTDLERLEVVAKRITESQIDLTAQYTDWVRITLACASLGEGAREAYHDICSIYPGYDRKECDEKFDNCLKTGKGLVTLGTLMQAAKDAGIDISMPRGRRPQSQQDKEEEKKNRMAKMTEMLRLWANWRYNIWHQRAEILEGNGEWRPIQDRDLHTFYCRLQNNGIKVTPQDVKSMIYSRDFCEDFDEINTWLDSLKPWNPDTDPDYLRDFYVGHLEFADSENEEFYDCMFKKWFVGLVAMMRGVSHENPIMPILKGLERIGKSFFARHILPEHLRKYMIEVGPATYIDKDFIISLSETPLILIDEFSFGSDKKNDIYKYLVTSNRSNLRDSYAHFRESRERRASLIATTNLNNFVPNAEGARRYLVVDLKGTVDLDNFPLPYEGAYAQALYLLEHGFQHKPDQDESKLITRHNLPYFEVDDYAEVLNLFFRQPEAGEQGLAMTAGNILLKLGELGYHGATLKASEIGKALKRMGFESKLIHGVNKYLVVEKDQKEYENEQKEDAKEFIDIES